MASVVYNVMKLEAVRAFLQGKTIKGALLRNTYTQNVDTDKFWSDVSSHETTGTNYTAGGEAVANPTFTQDDTDDEGVFDIDDVRWTNLNATFRHIVFYVDTGTPSTSTLIQAEDFGADQVVTNVDFVAQINAEGLLKAL